MRVEQILEKINMPNYSKSLLSTESHKTCTSLARNINKSHDALYKNFRDPVANKESIRDELVKLAQTELSGERTYLIFDDSQLSKPHAKEIEGLDIGFDGSTGRTELGLQMVSALLSNGNIKIPIDMEPYISKLVAGNHFKTKSELAANIFLHLVELFEIDLLLADAHYATKQFLSLLYKHGQQFLMKFACNRIVIIGKTMGQLKKIFRLRRNEHIRVTQGTFNGISYYFYIVKIKQGKTAYFVSLDSINQDELAKLYKIRWGIELYHRTAKQSLGWKDCQMRALEKQELHSFYVMYAYAIAELVRVKLKFKTTEDAIRTVWNAKSPVNTHSIYALGENFCMVA